MIRLSRLTLAGLAACLASRAASQCPSSGPRIAVAALSLAYTASAIEGARMSIRDSLYEQPFGIRSGIPVSRDFYFGGGTALSPGLPFLVAQAAITGTLAGPTPTARKSMDLLAIFGAAYTVGQLGEPLALHTLAHPRSSGAQRLRVVVGNIVLPAAMAIIAYRACR
jgi:hypothetical protein